MSTPSPLPLALTKATRFLENRTLGELIDPRKVQALIKSDSLGSVWDENNYSHRYSKQHHNNQCEQLKNFLGVYDPKQKVFTVNYTRGRSAYGRVFPKKALGLTSLAKKIRNTFISDTYYDFDLSNAQPAMVVNLCKANKIPCEKITHYIDNREEVLKDICEHYDVSRGCAKKLMLRLCFFGTVEGWKLENQKHCSSDLVFLTAFTKELETIAEKVKKPNTPLYDACRKKKEDKKESNVLGSFFSTYLQTVEMNIVSEVLGYIVDNTKLTTVEGCSLPVATYEYDGLKLLKANVDAFPGGKEAVIKLLTEKTLELSGFRLRWEEKEIDPGYELGDLGEAKDVEKMSGVETDLEAAEKLFSIYPYWVFCEKKLYVFDQDTGLWCDDRTSVNKVIHQHSDYLHVIVTKSGVKEKSTLSYGNTVKLRDKLPSILETLCKNNNWLKEKEKSSLKKLLFKNGYLDGVEGKFYHKDVYGFNPDIVFFGRIHHDFEICDEDYMNDIRERLFYLPLGKEQGEYMVQNLARGLMGDTMKRFMFGLGGTNCGKSVMTSAVTLACGDYVGAFNAENLALRASSDDEARSMRWALLLRYKRLIFSNEMKTKSKINGNMIKKLSSGGEDKAVGRTHGQEECEFIPHFLAIAFANDLPPITPQDDAVINRVKCLSFEKEFVSNPQEGNPFEIQKKDSIKQEIQTLAFQKALVRLLCSTYVRLIDEGIPEEPPAVVEANEEWIGDDLDPMAEFLLEFRITDNEEHFTQSSKIEAFFDAANIDIGMKKFGGLLKKYCILNGHKSVKRGAKSIKGKTKKVWFGIEPILEVETRKEECLV